MNNNQSESVEDDGREGTFGPYRRDIMKALGAGTAVGLFGGIAAADEHDEEADDDNEMDDEMDDETIDEDEVDDEVTEQTVHTVRTLITESTNPERPADFFYQPTGLAIEAGDVIKFVFTTPDHTVTSYHPAYGMQRRIPSGVQPFSSPILGWEPHSLPDDIDMPPEPQQNGDGDNGPTPTSWLHAFETPGVYDLECAPHEAFGMAMRVVVGEETETEFETSDPDQLPPPRAGPVEFSRQVLTDPNLEPEAIVEEGRVEWMDLEANQEVDDVDDESDEEVPDEEENDVDDEPEDDENDVDDEMDDDNGANNESS